MEVKLYKENNRTIIVIEDGSVDLDAAVFALVNTAITKVEGLTPPQKSVPQKIEPKAETEMTKAPAKMEDLSVDIAERMLKDDKEAGLFKLITVLKNAKGELRDELLQLCKEFAIGIKNNLPEYSYDDKIRLVSTCAQSKFIGKYKVLEATGYGTFDDFLNGCTENELDVVSSAFAEMLNEWGNR